MLHFSLINNTAKIQSQEIPASVIQQATIDHHGSKKHEDRDPPRNATGSSFFVIHLNGCVTIAKSKGHFKSP